MFEVTAKTVKGAGVTLTFETYGRAHDVFKEYVQQQRYGRVTLVDTRGIRATLEWNEGDNVQGI